MSKGVLLFAYNNSDIDYVKQAIFSAKRIKEYLKLPVALVTDDIDYSKKIDVNSYINFYILSNKPTYTQNRHFQNGVYITKTLQWSNHSRADCYDLTPFDETIVMDTDFIVSNDTLRYAFNIDKDVMLYKSICDVVIDRDNREFDFITDKSIPMWWATVFFFRKNEFSKIFFNTVKHVKENWSYYRLYYQISNSNFRNDFAFSIALHLLNGYGYEKEISELPGKMWFSTDKDIPLSISGPNIKILADRANSANYIVSDLSNVNVHIMNKFVLQELVEKEIDND